MKKVLPIGSDNFRKVREKNHYYVDKTLLIRDFLKSEREVTLITRPRRFGKTLNMSMLAEFFDITKDSRAIFEGLAIMDTEYADMINKMPVVYLSFKDCTASEHEQLRNKISRVLYSEYMRYYEVFEGKVDYEDLHYVKYYQILKSIKAPTTEWGQLEDGIYYLLMAVKKFFGINPILLLDEYDQPIISSHEHQYHDKTKEFFSGFYGSALKGQDNLSQALLTGIQRVAKESIFSKLNNLDVYTVLDDKYSPYFGFDTEETRTLLEYYDLELNDDVKDMYDGYLFGNNARDSHDNAHASPDTTHISHNDTHVSRSMEMYNPWSILNYTDRKELRSYWINTSSNYLIRKSLEEAGDSFKEKFNKLIINETVSVYINLETSFIELTNNSTLWGLLVNSGYLTIKEKISSEYVKVRIPNNEVNSEFQQIVSEQINLKNNELYEMMFCLTHDDIDGFLSIYRGIVLSCTSYHDSKEERKETASYEAALHMLFLGMCVSLRKMYKVTSNIESGHGRSDIILESLDKGRRHHVIIEFKQGEDMDRLKEEALNQIMENEYYASLSGKVLCIGLAHDVKRCEMAYKVVEV